MGKLIVTEADGKSRELALDKERVTIGRHADNDIALNDKAVSGHHAVVITILSDSFLEDLDSTNGTLVNGKQVAKHPLSHGDSITIGRNTLVYESEQTGDGEDFEKTMILRPGQVAAAMGTPPPAPAAAGLPSSGNAPLNGRLRVDSGSSAGKELELTKALTTIGKPGIQVAAITKRADGYYIVHVGGAAGSKRPLVNGAEIDAQARRLNPGDVVELAGTKMSFLLG
ncbi:FHA domain-containing protein [Stagnimonas aquatica]|uniref:FHA domain-containing protein n=1 Tax=Stagnimonas aquatica TaxID=2689987 RepID=A0A3N0V593_9GAMM|nr:FHA domain-containing protein [Stagnimonas aquatica]ROH87845.1 FHA domain-containing protein [Stagnimonas aquatica]